MKVTYEGLFEKMDSAALGTISACSTQRWRR
jgi:hypothetical protein